MPNQFLSDEFGDIEDYFVTDYWLIDQYIGDQLWVWGANFQGKLGINDTAQRNTPVTTFSGGTNWKQVAFGEHHTAVIKTDGSLWTWGLNSSGQVGDNTDTNRSTPVTTFAGGTDWKSVACGNSHTLAIKTDGSLWTWGLGTSGQLGINGYGTRSTPVTTFAGGTTWKQVSAGNAPHTAAIKTDGSLWVWGGNGQGQLGDNTAANRIIPVTTFAGGTNWKSVSCGFSHTAAIKTDGSLWTWGINSNGQLGINNTDNRNTPVTTFAGGNNWKQVDGGSAHTAAIKTDGSLWTWGFGGGGGLGNNTTITRSIPVTTFAGGNNWKQVSSGGNFTAAVKSGLNVDLS